MGTMNPVHERLVLDPATDTLTIITPSGMELAFEIPPDQMSNLSRWSFARKITHVIEGKRLVAPSRGFARLDYILNGI